MSCVFCLINEGKIPAKKVFENENVVAFLDISQATYGHTLVLPKKHYENIIDIPTDLYLEVMQVVKQLTPKLLLKLGTNSCNILNNCGTFAGQTVNHFHVHIIPRYENDDLKIEFTEHQENLDEILEKFN